jgi:hypothetical protein
MGRFLEGEKMIVNKFRTPLALALLLAGLGLSSQAQSVDYLSDVVRSVIDTNGHVLRGTVTSNGDIIDSSGHVVGRAAVGVIDQNGNIIDPSGKTITRIYNVPGQSTTTVVTQAAPTVFTAPLSAILDNRHIEIERMISKGEKNGRISASQAGEYRMSLQRIETAEIAAKASGGMLTYDESVDIARDLDSLAATVATSTALTPFTPLVIVDPSGSVRFSVRPNGYVMTSYAPGATTTQTVVSKSVVTPSGTTVYKTTTIEPVATSIPSDRLCTVLESRRDAINTMINDGLASGKISASQSRELRAQLDIIRQDEVAARASDNMMTYDEALALAVRFDDLSSRAAAISNLKPLWSMVAVDNGTRRLILEAPAGSTYSQTTTTTTSATPVYADRIIETTTTTAPGTVITTSAGTALVTKDAVGNMVTVRTVDPTLLVTTITVRRKDLDRMVHESIEKKVITPVQGQLILGELVRIDREAVPGITYGRAVILARDLDVITTQIGTYVTTIPQPIIAGSHMTISNGQIVELDDVSVRRSDLEARIIKDYLQGRLTSNQADTLRSEMNAVETMEGTFRNQHPGDLTLKESRILYTNFDKVASKLDKWAGKENRAN